MSLALIPVSADHYSMRRDVSVCGCGKPADYVFIYARENGVGRYLSHDVVNAAIIGICSVHALEVRI